MTDIKLKILTERDFLFLAKRKPEGTYDRETLKNLYRIIKRLKRGKKFCTGDEKQLLKKYQVATFGVLLPKNTDAKGKINQRHVREIISATAKFSDILIHVNAGSHIDHKRRPYAPL